MKAISLISGGLDSSLATKIILDQGIEVIGLNCLTPFSTCLHKDCNCVVKRITDKLGIELVVINLGEEFLDILKNPVYGYGSHINPCIDCKILMLKKAKELMPKVQAQFIITGEVLGQRPMSQNSQTLPLIENKSGTQGILVRPLSAKVLEPTPPEKLGWLDRDKLLNISGRARKVQLALAEQWGIQDYSEPSGGCLLTYEGYAKKVGDLIKYNGLSLDNVSLLKIGRHFRLGPEYKLIVGKDEDDNTQLVSLAKNGDWIFEPDEKIKGPVSLGRGEVLQGQLDQSCKILARYCDGNNNDLKVSVKRLNSDFEKSISCQALSDKEVSALRI
jgi:hypothetical protein